MNDEIFVYIGEKNEYLDNHEYIKNSFSEDQIESFSLLPSDPNCENYKFVKDIIQLVPFDFRSVFAKSKLRYYYDVEFAVEENMDQLAYPCGLRMLSLIPSKRFLIKKYR